MQQVRKKKAQNTHLLQTQQLHRALCQTLLKIHCISHSSRKTAVKICVLPP